MQKLVVIDISSFIFRAFYAIRPLTSPDGRPVNAVYGVLNMMIKLINDHQPTHLLIAKDSKKKSFRKDFYEAYKANRNETPEDLIVQFPIVYDFLNSMGIKDLTIDHCEADDVIGSVVTQWKDNFEEILIATGDKDLMQFVGGNIKIIDTKVEKIYTPEEVFKKFGVWPNQIIDYLSLVGDSSDNIPGMKGIGAKTASKLLSDYGTFENIDRDELKGKRVIEAFSNYLEDGLLSKKLVEIKTDLDLNLSIEEIKYSFSPSGLFFEKLKEFNFKALLKRFSDSKSDQQKIFSKELDIFSEKAAKEAKVISLCLFEDKIYSSIGEICFEVDDLKVFLSFLMKDVKVYVYSPKELFKKILKFEKELLNLNYIDLAQGIYVLEGKNIDGFEENIKKYLDLNLRDHDYPAFCHVLNILGPIIEEKIKNEKLEEVFYQIDNPLNIILADMENEGIKIDKKYFEELREKTKIKIQDIEAKLSSFTDEEVNFRSPKQVSKFLFEDLKFPIVKKTKTGASTDSEVLRDLKAKNLGPVPDLLLQHRELEKLLSTYIIPLPNILNENTGRIHTNFNQALTSTGRLSSDSPNLQNIPTKTDLGKMIRKGFCAKKGYKFLSADYSQIELRLLAHLSEDPVMIRSFEENIDIHTQTAAEVLGKKDSEISRQERSLAKAVNFGLMYGQSSFGLSRTLGISRKIAKEYIERYFEKFPKVKGYLDQLKERGISLGKSETLSGRRRTLVGINSENRVIKAQAERMAINTPVQGSAADIIKMAMIDIYRVLSKEKYKSKMLLQVHDELIFEVAENELDEMHYLVKEKMEDVIMLKVPLEVVVSVGENWFDLK